MEQAEHVFTGAGGAGAAVLSPVQMEQTKPLPLVTEFLAAEPESQTRESPEPPTEEAVGPLAPTPVVEDTTEQPANQEAPPPAQWIQQERDAFDWQGAAALAAKQGEEQRAADEWAATNWDPAALATDHVAAVLLRLAKQVQKGELKIDADRGMSPEAILAAALSALLRSET